MVAEVASATPQAYRPAPAADDTRRRTDAVSANWRAWAPALPVIVMIAGITRVAAANATLSIVGVAALTGIATAVGVRQAFVQKSRSWRRGWMLVVTSVQLFAAAAILRVGSTAGIGSNRPALAVGLVANVVAITGLGLLVRHRAKGRALDSLLEAGVVAGVTAFLVWTLASLSSDVHLPASMLAALSLNAAAVWVTARLLVMGPDRPPVLQFLLGGWVAKFAVNTIAVGGTLLHWPVTDQRITGLALWVFGLWAAGLIHPSLRKPLEPVHIRDSRDVPARAALLGTAVLVVPAVVGVQLLAGTEPRLGVVLIGASLLPLAVVLHMSYQLYERARAEYRAQHDPLTGLPNRNLFHDRLHTAVAQAERSSSRFAVMFLDLDRFKTINDSLGHAAGNALLQQVARRIRSCVREQDTLARMGGDEFTLLITGVDEESATVVAGKLLDSFTAPFVLAGRPVFTSTSVGIATYPTSGRDADVLLKNADTAMYQAKARGRNNFEFYSADMSARATVRLSLESSLHTALENGHLTLHYQPQVSMADGRLVGLEALARWRHPRLGYISPYAFIPLAEESGLIQPLGEWAVESACRQLRDWREAGLPVVPVAVNVSARQVANRSVDELVERVLTATGVPGELLEVELTETVLVDDFRRVSVFLDRLKKLGVRTSIDDFGTGYSGLSYLARMPIDSLKIDRSFVRQLASAGGDHAIVRAIIALAGNLGLEVVAEGVETIGQARSLLEQGCGRMQGYLVSPPVPVERVPDLLRRQTVFTWPVSDTVIDVVNPSVDVAPPVTPLLDDPRVAMLLQAVCSADASSAFDPEVLAAVLAALAPAVPAQHPLSRPLSARLATGTFAGLVPLSGGLAYAGVLPAPVQHAYSQFLGGFGIPGPAEPAGSTPAESPTLIADGGPSLRPRAMPPIPRQASGAHDAKARGSRSSTAPTSRRPATGRRVPTPPTGPEGGVPATSSTTSATDPVTSVATAASGTPVVGEPVAAHPVIGSGSGATTAGAADHGPAVSGPHGGTLPRPGGATSASGSGGVPGRAGGRSGAGTSASGKSGTGKSGAGKSGTGKSGTGKSGTGKPGAAGRGGNRGSAPPTGGASGRQPSGSGAASGQPVTATTPPAAAAPTTANSAPGGGNSSAAPPPATAGGSQATGNGRPASGPPSNGSTAGPSTESGSTHSASSGTNLPAAGLSGNGAPGNGTSSGAQPGNGPIGNQGAGTADGLGGASGNATSSALTSSAPGSGQAGGRSASQGPAGSEAGNPATGGPAGIGQANPPNGTGTAASAAAPGAAGMPAPAPGMPDPAPSTSNDPGSAGASRGPTGAAGPA